MSREVLITGGLGFIGSNLAHRCVSEGYGVSLISSTDKKIKNIRGIENKVKLTLKDVKGISKEDVLEKDYIFHCASTVDNYNIQTNPYLDVDINCNGTIAVLEACKNHNPNAKIIYPSTFFVNGNLRELPATSISPCEPLGLYPATKLAAEHFCKIYSRVFDLDVVIGRLTNVFGIREQMNNNKKAAFNRMIATAVDNGTISLYDNGKIKRDYIYISDVIDALLTLAEKGKKEEIYYVGLGEGVKFREMVDIMIEEAKGGKIDIVSPPKFHKSSGIDDFWCDNSSLRNLGWNPKVTIREGIKKVIDYYKNEKK